MSVELENKSKVNNTAGDVFCSCANFDVEFQLRQDVSRDMSYTVDCLRRIVTNTECADNMISVSVLLPKEDTKSWFLELTNVCNFLNKIAVSIPNDIHEDALQLVYKLDEFMGWSLVNSNNSNDKLLLKLCWSATPVVQIEQSQEDLSAWLSGNKGE